MNTADPHGEPERPGLPQPLRSVPVAGAEQPGSGQEGVAPARGDHRPTIPDRAWAHQGHRAGLVSRTAASAIDAVVVVVLLTSVYVGLVAARFLLQPQSFTWPAPKAIFAIAGFLGMLTVYLTASWATTGRTYGDHVMGLRVVNFRGRRLRWAGAFLRAVACGFFPIGLFWVAVSPQNRSLQDVVLRTSVVYDWREGAERVVPG